MYHLISGVLNSTVSIHLYTIVNLSGSVHYDKCWLQLIRSTKSGCAAVTKQRACVVRIHLKKSAATIYRYWQHGCLNQDDKRVDMIHSNDKAFTPT